MRFKNFTLAASPFIADALCPKCGHNLQQVSNGWLSIAMFCRNDREVYLLELRKVPSRKVDKEFLEQCLKETEPKVSPNNG